MLCFFFCSITCFPEIKQHSKILDSRIDLVKQIYPIFIQLNVLEDFSSSFIIIPKAGA